MAVQVMVDGVIRDATPDELGEIVGRSNGNIKALKVAKNEQINGWRSAANTSTFAHADKHFDCDALSRSDIDGVANHIGLFGDFPTGFPGMWKAADNTMLPVPDVDAFRALYASMTAQGAANFMRSQVLKAQLENASTAEEIAAITW
ncbi:DUF4376 domain-containing protein [Massilia sp. YIM B02443]|uniref:DUF4376 domain-containing protein n=1 Tax=Massilia sp. YIM B02443 TaxID=3050127 RepID=UPI0025B6711C|nr:DUF4376 domain-containing protein [Massilia sp. YIM B02443]MDN4036806.1 DUF4376 domain-containing protein [Massilia sp. YIM B02443]